MAMTDGIVEKIFDESARRIRETDCLFHRYVYSQIDWSGRVVALNGARGVGKTTLFLQYLKEHPDVAEHSLYLSLDSIWMDKFELYDLAEYHVKHGGTSLFLDEIHYLKGWSQLVKNLYDAFKSLRIAYTGSSLLRIKSDSSDLSRRQVEYHMAGLSFREYLTLVSDYDFNAVSLEDLVSNHLEIAESVVSKVRVLPHFEKYLKIGYYPFFLEDSGHYDRKLTQVINQVLERDLPMVEDVTPDTVRKARKMLSILAASTPQLPNVSELARNLEMDRKQGLKILYALRNAGLLGLLAENADKLKALGAPAKMYCDNANIMHVLAAHPDKGTLREAYFLNQLGVSHAVTYPRYGDYLVDDKWLFEVGGAGKRFTQIKDLPSSYLAVDDIEVGRGNKIPLWLFGFLY